MSKSFTIKCVGDGDELQILWKPEWEVLQFPSSV